jgi:hypothetical protein
MFSLLGVLNNYRQRIRCPTLDHLFGKINLDARSWELLLRSQLPANELAVGMEQLLDTVTEFVKRSVQHCGWGQSVIGRIEGLCCGACADSPPPARLRPSAHTFEFWKILCSLGHCPPRSAPSRPV